MPEYKTFYSLNAFGAPVLQHCKPVFPFLPPTYTQTPKKVQPLDLTPSPSHRPTNLHPKQTAPMYTYRQATSALYSI